MTISIKKAVIYCRTATTTTGKPDLASHSQVTECREYAKDRGYEVTKVFFDCGVSGLSEERCGMKNMLAFLRKQKEAYAVIVTTHDRLARSLEIFGKFQKLFAKMNVELAVVYDVFAAAARRFV